MLCISFFTSKAFGSNLETNGLLIVTRNVYFIDRADGGCRHIAAALFELLATVVNSEWRHAQAKCVRGSERGKEMKVVSLFVSLMWDDQNMAS